MINDAPPFKGLNMRIPIIIPMTGRGFINHGSGLPDWGFCRGSSTCRDPHSPSRQTTGKVNPKPQTLDPISLTHTLDPKPEAPNPKP